MTCRAQVDSHYCIHHCPAHMTHVPTVTSCLPLAGWDAPLAYKCLIYWGISYLQQIIWPAHSVWGSLTHVSYMVTSKKPFCYMRGSRWDLMYFCSFCTKTHSTGTISAHPNLVPGQSSPELFGLREWWDIGFLCQWEQFLRVLRSFSIWETGSHFLLLISPNHRVNLQANLLQGTLLLHQTSKICAKSQDSI